MLSSKQGLFQTQHQRQIHPQNALNSYPSLTPNISEVYQTLLQPSETPISCNFVSQVIDTWALNPNKHALRCIDLDADENHPITDITYADIVQRSHQIGAFLDKQGLKKGDAVMLMLGQHPAWWYSLAALIRKGIAVVPSPRLLTENDIAYRINDLKIRGVITTPFLQSRIDRIQQECPSLTSKITLGPHNPYWHSMDDIFKYEPVIATSSNTTTEDVCVHLYTSGTTGQPKAVTHYQDYPFFHWPTGKRWLQATPEDLIYNASDTGWGFTVWITLAAWSMGAKLLITPTNKKFEPRKMLSLLSTQPITIFCAAPTVLRLLVAQPDFNDYTFPHLKKIVTVGEALDETVIQCFAERGVEVSVGFGQAETPLIIGRMDDQPHVPNTMGKAIHPYKVVLLDDNLVPLKGEGIGQIAVDLTEGHKGVMKGYENAPEATQRAFSPNKQYYLSGDWAQYRSDGLFVYQGRRDDLMKSRGYRVGPDEVEKAGMSHPAVAKIAVVAITDANSLGKTIKAFILLKPNYVETPELIQEIQIHIKKETAPHKYPRLVECLSQPDWEKYETTSGKIRRRALRERDEALREEALRERDENQKSSITLRSRL